MNQLGMYNHEMPEDISVLKEQLRQQCRKKRVSLSEDSRSQASLSIRRYIQLWSVFQEAQVIFTYMPMNEEVDLLPLLTDNPQKEWVIPRIQPHSQMILHPYYPQKLVRHRFGMLEPDSALPRVPSDRVELVLVPGLAFDHKGWRLGYGGGFYDTFLSALPGLVTLGITYHTLLLDELPHMAHDIPVMALVTEKGIQDISLENKG
ncbi:MAG: 5-formyltetrahydrofolate cyclo-ligase [Chloroflexi bacterium]|nr:MAG: 5-formyltetrahydrofolate cyclo-ligase [Chloroflexota bacterium]